MNTMFLRHIFMAGLATACGIAVSAGTFAFLLVIGVIPRMIKRCNFGERILMVENTVILGVLTGAVFSVVEWKAPAVSVAGACHFGRLWNCSGNFCGMYCGGTGRNIKYFSDPVPASVYQPWTQWCYDCHGTGENGWFFLLFLFWLRASEILVNPYFLIAIFFVSGV